MAEHNGHLSPELHVLLCRLDLAMTERRRLINQLHEAALATLALRDKFLLEHAADSASFGDQSEAD